MVVTVLGITSADTDIIQEFLYWFLLKLSHIDDTEFESSSTAEVVIDEHHSYCEYLNPSHILVTVFGTYSSAVFFRFVQ